MNDVTEIIRAKGILDDATTLAEAAQKTRQFADHLQGLHDEGCVLIEQVHDDYACYRRP